MSDLRAGVANVSILLGLFALAFLVAGGADGPRLAPTVIIAFGAVAGVAAHAVRSAPRLRLALVITAAAATVGGMVALAFVVA